MIGKLVLADDLLVLLETFHQQDNLSKTERKLYNNLIKAYEPNYATNYEQLKRIKDRICINEKSTARYQTLVTPIINSTPKGESLEQLAQKTVFKLILTTDETNNELPYYNITKTNPYKALTYHCKANQSRKPLKLYLTQLCTNAKNILICDNYFAANWNNTQSLLLNTIPRKELTLEYVETAPNTAVEKIVENSAL